MLGLLKIACAAAALLLSASHVEAKRRDGRLHPNLPPRPLLPIEDVPQLKAFHKVQQRCVFIILVYNIILISPIA